MKTLHTTITLLLILVFLNPAFAQVRVGAWEIHEGNEGVIDFATPDMAARVAAFGKAKIPAESDPKWETAKTQADGTVDYPDLGENVKRCAQQLDFTYFQTTVNIPDNVDLKNSTFTVSFDKADDGARIYFFNDTHKNGSFKEGSDLILNQSKYKEVDLKYQLARGENRLVIVQYNQCTKNSLRGIRVKVNSKEIPPTVLPRKFSLHGYSVNGKRVEKGSNYWIAYNPKEQDKFVKGRILSPQNGTVMQIEKVNLDEAKGIVGLKVMNAPEPDTYLAVADDYSVVMAKHPPQSTSNRHMFKIRQPEEKSATGLDFVSFESIMRPNHFLRHEGYVLKVTPATDVNRKNVVYRQDASWLFEPMK